MSTGVGALEGRPAREHLVKNDAQTVDIAGGAGLAPAERDLFRSHVGRRADDRARQGQARADGQPRRAGHALGQAEIGDVRLALAVDEDVRRLEVAVKDATLMRERDRSGNRRQERRRVARAKRSVRLSTADNVSPSTKRMQNHD